MRTQDEIQGDIRDLRRQYEALDIKGKNSIKHPHRDVRSDKRQIDILAKIKELSQEFLAVIKANQIGEL